MPNESENEIIKQGQSRQDFLEELERKHIEYNDKLLGKMKKEEEQEELHLKTISQREKLEEEVFAALQNNNINDYVFAYKSLSGETIILYGRDEYESAIIAKHIYKALKDKVLSKIIAD